MLLVALERDLWVLMAEVATAPANRRKLEAGKTLVTQAMVDALESEIDRLGARAVMPTEFVVPGENRVAAFLDVARTVVRRAERLVVTAPPAPESLVGPYLNRLSDLLWTMARWQETEHLTAESAQRAEHARGAPMTASPRITTAAADAFDATALAEAAGAPVVALGVPVVRADGRPRPVEGVADTVALSTGRGVRIALDAASGRAPGLLRQGVRVAGGAGDLARAPQRGVRGVRGRGVARCRVSAQCRGDARAPSGTARHGGVPAACRAGRACRHRRPGAGGPGRAGPAARRGRSSAATATWPTSPRTHGGFERARRGRRSRARAPRAGRGGAARGRGGRRRLPGARPGQRAPELR